MVFLCAQLSQTGYSKWKAHLFNAYPTNANLMARLAGDYLAVSKVENGLLGRHITQVCSAVLFFDHPLDDFGVKNLDLVLDWHVNVIDARPELELGGPVIKFCQGIRVASTNYIPNHMPLCAQTEQDARGCLVGWMVNPFTLVSFRPISRSHNWKWRDNPILLTLVFMNCE